MVFVLFDIGDVTVTTDEEITFSLLTKYGIKRKKAENFFFTKSYLEFSRGKISSKEFTKRVCKDLGGYVPPDIIRKAHDDHFYALNKGVLSVIKSIPKEKRGFLTDTNDWQVKRVKKFIDMRKYSNFVFESHKIGSIKLDGKIFDYAIKRLKKEGYKPDEILLIDNDMFKCRSARKHGLRTYLFTDSKKLKKYMAKMEKEFFN